MLENPGPQNTTNISGHVNKIITINRSNIRPKTPRFFTPKFFTTTQPLNK